MFNILRKNYIYILGFILLIGFSCAIMRPPEGGPKDFTPPKLVSSEPTVNAVNFSEKRIVLSFDEFISLKDVQKSFVMSPPSKKRVNPKLRGNNKEILIELEEDLKPNTTYTLSFGNSVVDLHESNPIPNFTFAFSTGNVIDSLSLTGRVLDAITHQPDKEGMYVMLYQMFNDSVPRKTLPAFVTKTNPKGWFTIPHVYADTFMIFALKDANMNMMFDQPSEEIAFADTLITLNSSYFEAPDTSRRKPIVFSDSISVDSIDFFAGKKSQIDLFLFRGKHNKPNFLEYTRSQPNQFTLSFELPPDSLNISLLNPKPLINSWFIKDDILNNDTLSFWIRDTSLINRDTLLVKLSFMAIDSMNKPYLKNDTIKMVFKRPTVKAKRAALAKVVPKLSVSSSSSRKSEVDLNDIIFLETSLPVSSFDKKKMALYMKEDTSQVLVDFDITRDSVYLRRFNLAFQLGVNREYSFVYDTIAFTSIYGQNNDSSAIQFKTRNDDFYGTIKLNLKNTKGPMIVQVLSEKGDLVKQKFVNADGLWVFDFVAPAKYGLKVIYDANDNKQWDTGDWGTRLQPEQTEFYIGNISVRSNWEVEINWELKGK
jgi:hypothetical protein